MGVYRLTISVRQQQGIKCCLSSMRRALELASLDFKGYCKISCALVIFHDHFYSCVHIPFEPVCWRPDVLFNVEELGDTQPNLFAVTIVCLGFGLQLC